MQIDINADMGESFGLYRMGNDEEFMRFITSANIACGFHAGDPTVMHKTVALAKAQGVQVGAHPGLPDRQGFGRREMNCSVDEIYDDVMYQAGALKAFVEAAGMSELKKTSPPRSAASTTTRSPVSGRLIYQPKSSVVGSVLAQVTPLSSNT